MNSGPTEPSSRRLVIGYGNSLRGDDAAGPILADRIAALALPGVTVLARHQLTPELAAELAACAAVVFVDATRRTAVAVESLVPDTALPGLGHTGSPAQLLALAQALYGACPRAWLVTVPAARTGFGTGLSRQAAAGVEAALAEVLRLLDATAPLGR